MARIRTIKPEFWTSPQVMECSPNARLLFIGLWNWCDDGGRMTVSSKRIKAQIFPSDDISSENVRRMLDELATNGLIEFYTIENTEYLEVTGWHHQKIDWPTCVHPDKNGVVPPSKRRAFTERSTNVRPSNGKERKGREVRKNTVSSKEETGARRQSSNRTPTRNGHGRDPPPSNGELFPGNGTKPPEAELYRRGREVLGKDAGGFIKKLLTARDGNVAMARADIETASTKDKPLEWIGGVIRHVSSGRTSDGWLAGNAII